MKKGPAVFNKIRDRGVLSRFPDNHRVLVGILAIGQFAGMLLMTERPARAYVDPGSGLLALQMLGASVAGGLFFLRRKLWKLVGGKRDRMPRVEESGSLRKTGDQERAAARSPRGDT